MPRLRGTGEEAVAGSRNGGGGIPAVGPTDPGVSGGGLVNGLEKRGEIYRVMNNFVQLTLQWKIL